MNKQTAYPLKIVHTEASGGWGGQEIRILDESKGMIERDHEVTVICSPKSRIFEEGLRRGVPTVTLPIGRKNLRGFLAMRRWLKMNPVDVINTHSSTDTWLAALACQTLRHPPSLVRTRHVSVPVANNFANRWLYKNAIRHVVTTGESLRRQLIEQNGIPAECITSIPTGIDPLRFHPGDKAEIRRTLGLNPTGHYIGIVATLRSWKGHLYLLEAFASLNQPEWTLLIVGDGPMRTAIEAKIIELGIENRVQLVGQQNNPEDWLRALDIFVLPSYANEGVPQALLQAMFTGLPIVTTPVGAILEAVSDNETALIVPHKNSLALAAALTRLISDSALGLRLGGAAREKAKMHFLRNWMLDKMESIMSLAMDFKS
ncbi:MAG: glycosyltransferase family 4 protein [Rhodocyclaceae bacterium]|nr:glycosyltransferase family 4 protein [Rhodocyclaceae bacterium]